VKIAVPTGQEVCQKQLLALMHKVHEVKVNEKEIAEFLPAVYEELKDLTKDELIKRFASIEFNRFLEYYRNAPDLNSDSKGRPERGQTAAMLQRVTVILLTWVRWTTWMFLPCWNYWMTAVA
jgi:ATP-dependent RNA helicase DeaD